MAFSAHFAHPLPTLCPLFGMSKNGVVTSYLRVCGQKPTFIFIYTRKKYLKINKLRKISGHLAAKGFFVVSQKKKKKKKTSAIIERKEGCKIWLLNLINCVSVRIGLKNDY